MMEVTRGNTFDPKRFLNGLGLLLSPKLLDIHIFFCKRFVVYLVQGILNVRAVSFFSLKSVFGTCLELLNGEPGKKVVHPLW